MWKYQPAIREMRFVIQKILKAQNDWKNIPAFAELDNELADQVIEEAAKYATEILAPTNVNGDIEGCHWSPDGVKTPKGYPEAYKAFCDGGWPALACDPEYGGQGLPQLLNTALYEMLIAANHAWAMYPGLLHGAYECIKSHASQELKDQYLSKVVSGEWLATMCLTESHAGSDLGLIRTKGIEQADGSIAITGNKIFISGGDQDMTDNIVHLVIFRLPDAPPGSKGISLALVPKFLPDGTRNGVGVDSIEKKMGIKGSATCVMNFENAKGWLIGQPNRGLEAMFLMMNSARVHVAIQGLAHLDNAAKNALEYAKERVQMRALKKPEDSPKGPADAIVYHPAMRRNLLELLALAQAGRVVAYWSAHLIDISENSTNDEERKEAHDFASLLTPVIKSYLTEIGHHGANKALQTWGGHGFIHDYGIEQSVRDSRIAMIYEGTNEIQALDLLCRKILPDGGKKLNVLLDKLLESAQETPKEYKSHLENFVKLQKEATNHLLANGINDPEWSQRIATDYLKGMAFTLLTWAWAKVAQALKEDGGQHDQWHKSQADYAQFGIDWLLDEGKMAWERVGKKEAALPWL
jgi:alkylation response protein AidB-like acyl-CoA dehydrogenase